MARTRSTPANKAKGEVDDANGTVTTETRYKLPEETPDAPKVFVLPKQASANARFVTLPNPRYSKPTRYLLCPETGLYEFTKIAAPKDTPRSWLIEPTQLSTSVKENSFHTHITNGADLFMATLFDPLFLLLPPLCSSAAESKSENGKNLFLSSEDHFDSLTDSISSHLSEILRCERTRSLFETRMEAVCDTVEAGDEKMFRLNEKKLILEILSKAKAMSCTKLPPSMEEKFVRKVLEAPLSTQRSEAIAAGQAAAPVADAQTTATADSSTPKADSAESQSSSRSSVETSEAVSITASFTSEASTAATSITGEAAAEENVTHAMNASAQVLSLQRLKVAFDFICSNYVSTSTAIRLQELLQDETVSGIDFTPLKTYLADLAKLRAEAVASRSAGDYGRKRRLDEDEDAARAEKKRKLEEEKKRKANESRGVRELKKVNTTGMKKMSDFFKKK